MYVQETLYSICGNISFVCPGMSILKIIITMWSVFLKPIDEDDKTKGLLQSWSWFWFLLAKLFFLYKDLFKTLCAHLIFWIMHIQMEPFQWMHFDQHVYEMFVVLKILKVYDAFYCLLSTLFTDCLFYCNDIEIYSSENLQVFVTSKFLSFLPNSLLLQTTIIQ